MKLYLLLTLLVAGLITASTGHAAGSANRVATLTLGKRFDPIEVDLVVEPVLTPLGLTRLSGKAQDRALGPTEMSLYGALGYAQGIPSLYFEATGGLSVLIFADRSLDCVRISATDWTQTPDRRVIPTIHTISTALAQRYGSRLKRYSDLQCLHALQQWTSGRTIRVDEARAIYRPADRNLESGRRGSRPGLPRDRRITRIS